MHNAKVNSIVSTIVFFDAFSRAAGPVSFLSGLVLQLNFLPGIRLHGPLQLQSFFREPLPNSAANITTFAMASAEHKVFGQLHLFFHLVQLALAIHHKIHKTLFQTSTHFFLCIFINCTLVFLFLRTMKRPEHCSSHTLLIQSGRTCEDLL